MGEFQLVRVVERLLENLQDLGGVGWAVIKQIDQVELLALGHHVLLLYQARL